MAHAPNLDSVGQFVDYGSSDIVPMHPLTQSTPSALPQHPLSVPSTPGNHLSINPTSEVPHSTVMDGYGDTAHQDMTLPYIATTTAPDSNTFTPTRKRKEFGPTNDVRLPPPKRSTPRGPMSPEEREERKRMRKEGACAECRTNKKKASVHLVGNLETGTLSLTRM